MRFDCWQETPLSLQHSCEGQTTLSGQAFERGVWYYSGIEMIDHHDISGFENPWAAFETMCGRETRPQLCINILNRLRMLDFSEQDSNSQIAEGEALFEAVCPQCKYKHSKEKSSNYAENSGVFQLIGSEVNTSARESPSDISFNGSDQ